MKYTSVNVHQLKNRKGKPWQARAKYKDVDGTWKSISKMLTDANGKKEAQRMANEWKDTLNAEADKMPNASKAKTLDETFKEYLKFQLDTGAIEKSTYSNSIQSYNKYISPNLCGIEFGESVTPLVIVLFGNLAGLVLAIIIQGTSHTLQ